MPKPKITHEELRARLERLETHLSQETVHHQHAQAVAEAFRILLSAHGGTPFTARLGDNGTPTVADVPEAALLDPDAIATLLRTPSAQAECQAALQSQETVTFEVPASERAAPSFPTVDWCVHLAPSSPRTLCGWIHRMPAGSRTDPEPASRIEADESPDTEDLQVADRIFQSSPAPLGLFRVRDGCFVDVNDALCRLLGRSRLALLDQPLASVWDAPDACVAFHERLANDGTIRDLKVQLRHTSGQAVTVLASFQQMAFHDEACVLMSVTDVTDREKAREALVAAKAKAEDAQQKAEEVDRFRSSVLANMTHEVRTPLTAILGFTSVLREGVDGRLEHFVDLIERSGHRLRLTLDSLLDLANLEAGTMSAPLETHAVPDLMHTFATPLQQRVEDAGLAFRLDLPNRKLCARLNEDLLMRVLTHLVDNAAKFTSDGHVLLRVDGDADSVRLQVEDTGPGIDAAFLPRIYESFSQASEGSTRTHQGSGLGLTVAQRITEYMNGVIGIDTQKNDGTTVTLRFPRVDAC